MAKLKADLFGVPNGEVYPRMLAAGDECPPELEEAALEIGALESAAESAEREAAEAKAMKAAENKAVKPAENK